MIVKADVWTGYAHGVIACISVSKRPCWRKGAAVVTSSRREHVVKMPGARLLVGDGWPVERDLASSPVVLWLLVVQL